MPHIPSKIIASVLRIFLIGGAFGFADDFFRTLFLNIFPGVKKTSKLQKAVLAAYDALFLLSYTVLFILVLYYANNGAFRGVYLFSLYIGYSAYKRTLIGKTARRTMNALFSALMKHLIMPIVIRVKKGFIFLYNSIANSVKRKYNRHKEKKKRNTI